jgi:hypothetical protein
MKKNIHFLVVVMIGFSLFFGAHALAEEPAKSLWPSPLASTQWYWFGPDCDYSAEKIESDLKAFKNSVWMSASSDPKKIIALEYIIVNFRKTKSGRIPTAIDLKEVERFHTFSNLKDYFYNNTPFLYYSFEANIWFLKIVKPGGDYLVFHFSNEEDARKFGSILASSCKLAGLLLPIPKVGFTAENLTSAQAEALGKTRLENVLVTQIALDGPMDKSSIKVSDIITEVNGVWVKNASHFDSLIDAAAPGSIVKLTCLERVETMVNGQKTTEWKPKTVEMAVR